METSTDNLTITFSVVLMLFGVASCIYGVYLLRKQSAVMALAQTEGKIIKSELTPDDDALVLYFEYEYRISGVRYTSSQIVPEGREYSLFGIPEKYPLGTATTVYYNPNNPKEAFLERGNNNTAILYIVIGMVDIIFWVAYMLGFNVFFFLK
ncbi:MAG: hypothetical protein HY22_01995 [[Candidatus Thermochlorobacteriaceae] bacterium GBChlB]|nr:MAG: hypothetical protein HY22_01995 [[Candidatus Thermochlorobacteriaceae] bacterium GBChlB]